MVTIPGGAAALADVAAVAIATTFLPRVQVAGTMVALEVLGEDPETFAHSARVQYARQFLAGSTSIVVGLAWAVVADLVTGASSTDQALCDRVEVVWDAMAAGLG